MKRLLASTALATLLATGTVFAQAPGEKAPDAAQQQMQQKQPEQMQKAPDQTQKAPDQAADKDQATAGDLKFVQTQEEKDWMASTLIGRAVKNAEGKTLGDINDVILDQDGKVVAVLIGVGGFLGIGQKEVGVAYDALEFKKKEVKQPVPSPGAVPRPGQPPGGSPTAAQPPRKDYSHSDMEVVLDATKEQLEAAPDFARIGETAKPAQERTSDSAPDTEKPRQ